MIPRSEFLGKQALPVSYTEEPHLLLSSHRPIALILVEMVLANLREGFSLRETRLGVNVPNK